MRPRSFGKQYKYILRIITYGKAGAKSAKRSNYHLTEFSSWRSGITASFKLIL